MKTKPRSLNPKIWSAAAVNFVLLLLAATASAQWSGTTNIYYNSGTVGVGTNGATAPLSISGSASSPSLTSDTSLANIKSSSTVELGFGGYSGAPYGFWMQTKRSPNDGGSYPLMLNPLGGNIGIGTTDPTDRLEVRDGFIATYHANASLGAGYAINFYTDTTGSTKNTIGSIGVVQSAAGVRSGAFVVNLGSASVPAEKFRIDKDGNVGVGTTTPQGLLHVFASSGSPSLLIGNGINSESRLRLSYDFSGSGKSIINSYRGASGYKPLEIDASNLILNYNSAGNVGIGKSDPSQKLEVVGNINVTASGTEPGNITLSGTIYAKYQDVAEWVPSSEQLPAGTVVVLDTTKSNQVIHSREAYDTRVAGVVSERPGLALGESGANKVLVATTGRVLVKVDASKGPIHIGDLLVSSDTPGVAMKSEPITIGNRKMHMPGTLIGKALEPLEKGSGKILVLLSLQ
jgi:hypothetical protein